MLEMCKVHASLIFSMNPFSPRTLSEHLMSSALLPLILSAGSAEGANHHLRARLEDQFLSALHVH
jgi:hypothetical protein